MRFTDVDHSGIFILKCFVRRISSFSHTDARDVRWSSLSDSTWIFDDCQLLFCVQRYTLTVLERRSHLYLFRCMREDIICSLYVDLARFLRTFPFPLIGVGCRVLFIPLHLHQVASVSVMLIVCHSAGLFPVVLTTSCLLISLRVLILFNTSRIRYWLFQQAAVGGFKAARDPDPDTS